MKDMLNDMEHREWQDLRSRLAILESKLQKETIVNDRLMRRVMSDKVSGWQRDTRVLMVVAVLAIPYTFWVFHWLGLSLWFIVVTCLFLVAAIAYDACNSRVLLPKHFFSDDLLDVQRRVLCVKRNYSRWLCFSIPFLLVWLTWLCYEVNAVYGENVTYLRGIYTGMFVGGCLGGLCGWSYYRKTQRTIRELSAGIAELMEEK